MAMLAIGATSCNKGKEAKETEAAETTETNSFETIMDEALSGKVAYLNCDTVFTPETEVEKPTVVYFYAVNAPSCAPLKTPMEELAYQNEGKVAVIAVDVAAYPKTSESFGLDADLPLVPCVVVLFPNGKTKTYSERNDFITADLEEKTVDEQANGIYANLVRYAGLDD